MLRKIHSRFLADLLSYTIDRSRKVDYVPASRVSRDSVTKFWERYHGYAVPLTNQTVQDVYEEGSYMLRIRYDQPCLPSLSSDEQA